MNNPKYFIVSYGSDCDSCSVFPVEYSINVGIVIKRGEYLYQTVVPGPDSFRAIEIARNLILSFIEDERFKEEGEKHPWKPRGTNYDKRFWFNELGKVKI